MWQTIIYSGVAGLITILGIFLTRLWHRSSFRYSHYINSFAAGIILTTALAAGSLFLIVVHHFLEH